jgi:ADP-ribose pyrophosphatase
MTAPQEEPTVESHRAFEGRLFNVRVDTVRLPNGRLASREIVENGDSVCIVPLDRQNNVVLVRQYRKSVGRFLLEVPAGGMNPGEDPEEAARRELREETGYRAEKLERLSYFWTTPGFCTEGMYAYLATGLEAGFHSPEEDENIEVVRAALEEVPAMISSGEIQDGKSIASLLMVMAMKQGRINLG